MTREELFRAVGEVREDQIEAAETYPKKRARSWRRFGALAACLVLVLAVGVTAAELREADRWKAIVWSFNPGVEVSEDPDSWEAIVRPFQPEPEEGDAGGGGMDGCEYWSENPDRPLRPDYSVNVEIGELAGPGTGETMAGVSSCLAWLPPEAIFAQDTAIFRGTVRGVQYYQVEMDADWGTMYYTKALIEVTDPIRGGLETGEMVSVLWLGAEGYMTTSISGPLDDIREGSDAVFMPTATDRDTGWREGDGYFCYADLADFYLSEGTRYVFLDTGEELEFDQSLYTELAEVATLDDVTSYIRQMAGNGERTQPAAEPAAPQTEPTDIFPAGTPSSGPNGAREAAGD